MVFYGQIFHSAVPRLVPGPVLGYVYMKCAAVMAALHMFVLFEVLVP